MPLMKSKSKKAFEHNIKAEMDSGKPQKQALAIAYSVKRKPKKMAGGGSASYPASRPDGGFGKVIMRAAGGSVESGSKDMNMAEGGMINAKNERRPMPDNHYDDAEMIKKNSGNKPARHDNWLDNSTVEQAQSNNGRKVMPIKRPKMVPSDAFSTRLYDKEGMLQESARPGPYGEQPEEDYNEIDPKRQGPKVPDMEREHNNGRTPYAKGGMIRQDHGTEEMEREDEAHLMSSESPSEDEGASDAHRMNEEGQDRQGPKVPDMEDEHSTGRKPYAKGGSVEQYEDAMDNIDHDLDFNPAHDHYSEDDSEMQPEEEEREEHHNSIAAAIMAKKDREKHMLSDSDMDEMMRLYEGGEIKSHDSIYSNDSDMADMSRNHDEDANEEDQLSFNALRKENYNDSNLHIDQPRDSNLKGDDEEMDSHDKHDMISAIRSKMKKQRQF